MSQPSLFGKSRIFVIFFILLAMSSSQAAPQDTSETGLNDRDPVIRLAASRELIRAGDSTGLPVLAKLLLADSLAIRVEAALLLQTASGEKFGDPAGEALDQRRVAAVRWLRWASSDAAQIKNRQALAKFEAFELFKGNDFEGWRALDQGQLTKPAPVWKYENGIISCDGSCNGYLRTEQSFQDYVLSVEWRWPGNNMRSDSGVFILLNGKDGPIPRSGLEAQLLSGRAGDFWPLGRFDVQEDGRKTLLPYTAAKKRVEEKPLGEWNRMEILVHQGTVSVFVNNVFVNGVAGTPREGAIGLQVENHPIQFRNIELTIIEQGDK